MVRENDVGHAASQRLVVEEQGIDLPGRDDVVRMQGVDVKIGRPPALGQQVPGLIGLEDSAGIPQ